jgi:hypothetical protein
VNALRRVSTWIGTHAILVAAAACLAGYVWIYTADLAGPPIRSDGFSYYVYLPSVFLYHDTTLEKIARDCCGDGFPVWTNIDRWPSTGRWVNAHPIGDAILMTPFFAASHALTRWTNLPPDGFSLYYQHGAGLAGLAYVIAGLWILRRLLRRHYSDDITAATLLVLLFGTSLYHYATYDSLWSHAYSFALVAALLERLDVADVRRTRDAIVIGALAGAITLVRHPNLLIPVCFAGAFAASRLRTERGASIRFLAVAAAVAALVFLPQLAYYHSATGHWLISSYHGIGFDFRSPHLAGVLISPTKGVFFWAPVLLLGVAGFFLAPPRFRSWWLLAAFTVLIVDTYLIASWGDWQFGGSYGHRGFVDLYPMFAVGMAAALTRLTAAPVSRRVTIAVVTLLCALSMFQTLQYWHGVLPISDITWRQYKAAFLKPW